MTGADFTGADDFTGVDIDLLADYIGGALDGSPDQARVAALIEEQAAWREAHVLLSDGMAQVGATLQEWGGEPEPMPADVLSRLESALAAPDHAATPQTRLTLVRDSPGDAADGESEEAEPRLGPVFARPVEAPGGAAAASGPGLESVRKSGFDRRRRLARWGVPLAAAAAAVAIAGGGIAYLNDGSTSPNDSAASDAGGSAAAPGVAALPAGGAITSTNRDYTAESLRGDQVAPLATRNGTGTGSPTAAGTPTGRGESSSKSMATGEGLSDGLTRLRAPAALQACLEQIGSANGAGAISVRSVDYARFAGRPALVVHFTAPNGAWAWVSGPACGLPGVGPATAYSVQVG